MKHKSLKRILAALLSLVMLLAFAALFWNSITIIGTYAVYSQGHLVGCLFMIYAAFAAYGVSTVFHYLIVFAVIMVIGNLLYGGKKKA